MDNDITKVHVWELPEKTNEIDESNEYIMIHDGMALKKTTIKKLYEYLGQDYKIQNIIKYFETLMETENKNYDLLYSGLENSLDSYSKIIKELEDGFTINRDNIRRLETQTNQRDQDAITLTDSFKSIGNKQTVYSNEVSEFKEEVNNIFTESADISSKRDEFNSSVNDINNIITEVISNNEYITQTIDKIPDNIDNNILTHGEALTKKLNDEYDKIVAIIDYYHHIHE